MKKLILFLTIFVSNMVFSITDRFYSEQWALKNTGQEFMRDSGYLTQNRIVGVPGMDINLPKDFYKTKPENKEILVAVLDRGVDVFHPDLKGRIWQNKKTCPELPKTENEQLLKACFGYNALDGNGYVLDKDSGHGTHVAGIIAANKNKIGVRGATSSKVKILPVKILFDYTEQYIVETEKGRFFLSDIIADGILFALKNKADVINLSIGYPNLMETDRIKHALSKAESLGVPIIAAAGNNNKQVPLFPCANSTVICVGGYSPDGTISINSNFGGKVDVLAPGQYIVSTYPHKELESRVLRFSGYEVLNGSSMAAPYVSALFAELKSHYPNESLKSLKARVFANTHENLSKSKFTKYGRIDFARSLENKPKVFIQPNYKEVQNIKVAQDSTFKFSLPIENFLDEVSNVDILLKVDNSNVVLDKAVYKLDSILKEETKAIIVTGTLKNKLIDNNIKLNVEIKKGEFSNKTNTTLMLASDYDFKNKGKYLGDIPIKIAKDLIYISPRRSLLSGQRVFDPQGIHEYPVYSSTVSIGNGQLKLALTTLGKSIRNQEVILDNYSEVMKVFINDTDLDGEFDYFIYGMDAKEKNIQFEFLNKDGKPLFSGAKWKLPISGFEGLVISKEREENFQWLRTKTIFGDLLLPTVYKFYKSTELDVSDDFLEQEDHNINKFHLYYFEPYKENNEFKLRYRVFNNHKFISKAKQKYKLPHKKLYLLEEPFAQSKKDRMNGVISAFFTVGQEFNKSRYKVSIKSQNNYSMEGIKDIPFYLTANWNKASFDIDKKILVDNITFLRRNNERNNVRLVNFDNKVRNSRFDFVDRSFKTALWQDSIFKLEGTLKNEQDTFFFLSSLYSMYLVGESKTWKLPINRDSTMKNNIFEESFNEYSFKVGNEQVPGLYVDSTQIFGNKVYSMIKLDNDFIRPVALSYIVPNQCVALKPEYIGKNKELEQRVICYRDKLVKVYSFPISVE